jgi:hypothetical protein
VVLLLVVDNKNPNQFVVIITRVEFLSAHTTRLEYLSKEERFLHPRQKARRIWQNLISHD